jgi:phosphoribosylformylglycinamidine (FGAM) synthase-like enzyme
MDLKRGRRPDLPHRAPVDELGGSEYYRTVWRATGRNVPVVRFDLGEEHDLRRHRLDSRKKVYVEPTTYQRGLAATAAEMALVGRGDLGIDLDLDAADRNSPPTGSYSARPRASFWNARRGPRRIWSGF